jgi:RND superfamily putative drug exporter
MFSTASLARISARHPWIVVFTWIILLVLAFIAAGGLADAFTTKADFTNRPESVQANDLIKQRMNGGQDQPLTETVMVRSESLTVDDTQFRQTAEQTAADLRALPEIVASVTTYYDAIAAGAPDAASLVSPDRRTMLMAVTFVGDFDQASDDAADYLAAIKREGRDDVRILTVGEVSSGEEFSQLAEKDLIHGEGLGLLTALVVLVIVFGALVAAGVPIVLALVSIFVAVGLTALLGRVMGLSFFVVNMITMIGLAIGIDYALFIVSRYREERQRGRSKLDAIEITGGTASKAVLFSGTTVVLALLGMFLIPTVIFRSLGAGAILVVVVGVIATLTLVPALLSLLGDKIDWPRKRKTNDGLQDGSVGSPLDPQPTGGFWAGLTRVVMARPVVSVLLASGLLIDASVPYFDLEIGQAGVESLPKSDLRTAYEVLIRDFPAGRLAPVEIVIGASRSDEVEAGIDRLNEAMGQDPVFGAPETIEWNDAGDLGLLRVPLTVDSSSSESLDAVGRLRHDLVPAAFSGIPSEVLVTGAPAENADFENVINDYTPIVFAFVLGLSFLLLLLAFRSIVVPLKAIVMNLLSVGAAYGLLVLVFQKGYLHGFFGFQTAPNIENWIPIFLFCVLFGLSMDYHVFLLSRIREHYDLTHNNEEAVAAGLRSTTKIITGAALIMVAVFGGFASGTLVMFQQMGFGLAVAVILDATIVRSVLVPASMTLLGDRNWYLPRWLGWLPDLRIEGAPTLGAPASIEMAPAD